MLYKRDAQTCKGMNPQGEFFHPLLCSTGLTSKEHKQDLALGLTFEHRLRLNWTIPCCTKECFVLMVNNCLIEWYEIQVEMNGSQF